MDCNFIKHVHESPEAVKNTLDKSKENIKSIGDALKSKKFDMIILTGCGSSNNAAICAEYAFNKLLKIPARAIASSELVLYPKEYFTGKIVVAISRSGDKGDSVGAAKLAKETGVTVIAVTANKDSILASVADMVIYTYEGPEHSQPKTKSVLTMILVLLLLAVELSDGEDKESLLKQFNAVPSLIEKAISDNEEAIKKIAQNKNDYTGIILAGAGAHYGSAVEGSLKLKETCTLHAEAFATGEFAQGPLLVLDPNWLYIAFIEGKGTAHALKMLKAVKRRDAKTFVLTPQVSIPDGLADYIMKMPALPNDITAPLVYLVPIQLLTYYLSQQRGLNADFPKDFDQILDIILEPGCKEPEMKD